MPPLLVKQGRDRSDAVNRGKRFSRGKVTVREFHSDMILKTSHGKASLPLEKEQKTGGGGCGRIVESEPEDTEMEREGGIQGEARRMKERFRFQTE